VSGCTREWLTRWSRPSPSTTSCGLPTCHPGGRRTSMRTFAVCGHWGSLGLPKLLLQRLMLTRFFAMAPLPGAAGCRQCRPLLWPLLLFVSAPLLGVLFHMYRKRLHLLCLDCFYT
jgi:hypothetical protein